MRRILALFTIILFLIPCVSAYGVTFYNPTWNPQDGMMFDVVKDGEPYRFTVRTEDIAFTSITLRINRDAQNAGITLYNLKTVPDFLPVIPGNDSYEFNELKYTGFVPSDTLNFTYAFKVSKSWLENSTISRSEISFHVYDRVLDIWISIPTTITGDDESFVYYEALKEGVHYMFIGKSQENMIAESEEVSENAETTSTSETSTENSTESVVDPTAPKNPVNQNEASVITEDGEKIELHAPIEPVNLDKPKAPPVVAEEATKKPAPAPIVEEKTEEENAYDSKIRGVIFLVVLSAIIALIYIIITRKKVTYSVDKELHSYIKESLKRGKSKEEVRHRLLEVGWHHERVEKALAKHKTKKQSKDDFAEQPTQSEAQKPQVTEKPVNKIKAKKK